MPAEHLVPHGATARRITWTELPSSVRTLIEQRLGGPVVSAASQGSGFTPGFASRLATAGGGRVFVKAASATDAVPFADAYREEARKLRVLLPLGIPAPALRWVEDADWVVLCFDDVAGRTPLRPWRHDDIRAALDTVTTMASAMRQAPESLALPSFREEFGGWPGRWARVPPSGVLRRHHDEARRLAVSALQSCGGESVMHSDLRDDNLIVGDDGRVWVCDWNWPVRGSDWVDLVCLLISIRGDGHDADAMLEQHPLAAGVEGDRIDALLALLHGYFATEGGQDAPPLSPYLRIHQRWYADVTLDWLANRRGWEPR